MAGSSEFPEREGFLPGYSEKLPKTQFERSAETVVSGQQINSQIRKGLEYMTMRTPSGPRQMQRPRAVGYLRADLLPDQARHVEAIRRLAKRLGHRLIYVVRLGPDSVPDPVGHVLEIVRATATVTLIVPDLAHLENHPGRACDTCDLISVCPEQLWMKTGTTTHDAPPESIWLPDARHSEPDTRLRIADAQRIMQTHRTCNPLNCPRKAAAFALLIETGKLVPAGRSPRERAAARGIPYPSNKPVPQPEGPSMATLRRVRAGLAQVEQS
ncbi:hypothetical protein [Nocardia carnea]|uniref:hypothetical protein n=1 Tax=Nocardia carnea TaxID=37328 RepID=UPI0024570356|nr:hypothetical protein [Nocardia carnea]